jgi:hypothetical protein
MKDTYTNKIFENGQCIDVAAISRGKAVEIQDLLGADPAVVASLDEFTKAYLKCALWCTNDGSDESGGDFLDSNFSFYDIAPEALFQAAADCAKFQRAFGKDIEAAGLAPSRAGHCFWLNRNGHGSGFWDEEFQTPEQEAALLVLDSASKSFGEADPYVGGDAKIYGF